MKMPVFPMVSQRLRSQTKHFRKTLLHMAMISLVIGLVALSPSVYMLEVYGRVLLTGDRATLFQLTCAVLTAYMLLELLEYWRQQNLSRLAMQLDKELYLGVLSLIWSTKTGQNGSVLQWTADARLIRDGLSSPAMTSMMDVPVSLGFMVLVWLIHPWLGGLIFSAFILLLGFAWMSEFALHPLLEKSQQLSARSQRFADELLRQSDTLYGNQMQVAARQAWSQMENASWTRQHDASLLAGGLQAGAKWIQLVATSGLLGISAMLLIWDRFPGSPVMMIIASIIGGRALLPVVQLITHWRTVVQFRDAFSRLDTALKFVPSAEQPLALPKPQGHLLVEQVRLEIPAQPGLPPLSAIRHAGGFILKPGQVLAIVGPSGSGKSSLARLLAGVCSPSSGRVRLDGADLGRWTSEGNGGVFIGYLPQHIDLFEGTIEENICRFGSPDPVLLSSAIESTGLESIINQLPNGLATQVDQSSLISGGMRQRIGLARAMYGSPRLIVFDEPTAHLDDAGLADFKRLMGRLREERVTTVVVTHRRSILSLCDFVLVMKEGVQHQFDTAKKLLSDRPDAAEIV